MVASVPTKLAAAAVFLAFVLMAIVNALTTTGSVVLFTNAEIANTHPVYGLPAGYAFSIWGIIYLLEAVFVICQALPMAGLESDELGAIRLPVIGLFLANAVWLFLFGYQRFWVALIVIVVYDALLFVVLKSLDVNMFARKAWVLKLAAAAFGANASWVTVASCLQIQVNLLEEGWMPSEDFAVGLLVVAVSVASAYVYRMADPVYAAVAAWALGGIVANQQPSSLFGCAEQICAACAAGMAICERASSSTAEGRPNGWAGLDCDNYSPNNATSLCVVDKSEAVVGWAYAGIVAVALALVAGIVRALVLRSREAVTEVEETKDPEAPQARLSRQFNPPPAF